MEQTITLPVWIFVVLVFTALLLILDRILFPGVRWYLRRRVNRLIEEVNTRLDIEIRPFNEPANRRWSINWCMTKKSSRR